MTNRFGRKIAVLGSGGREHVLAWKLAQSADAAEVFVLPGNGGTKNNVPIEPGDVKGVQAFCRESGIDLVVVGPEGPLADGIVDSFQAAEDLSGVAVFGPVKDAARLESSKIWAKTFMEAHGVATARFWAFDSVSTAAERVERLGGDLVVKYDGLAGGKGVFVCHDLAEARAALEIIASKYGDDAPFLIEERLRGDELSILGFTDGRDMKLLLPSQDHKQVFDGDRGPNTGGMGAFSPVPFCTPEVLDRIRADVIEPTLNGLRAEGLDYRGVLYFGLMMTDDGPKVLEYNVRLGDPEAQVVLPSLKSDLLALITACIDGTLSDFELTFEPGAFVDVVLASGGYPGPCETGHAIVGLDELDEGTLAFHAATAERDGELVTTSGRVLNLVARGPDLEAAIEAVYAECEKVRFEGMHYRRDIGRRSG